MEAKHIQLLNKAKKRLKSAVKRFRQAEEFLDEFKAAVPHEEKDGWANIPAEYHLLFDCRRNIRGARHLTLRLLFQIHRVNFIERRKRYFLLTEVDMPLFLPYSGMMTFVVISDLGIAPEILLYASILK